MPTAFVFYNLQKNDMTVCNVLGSHQLSTVPASSFYYRRNLHVHVTPNNTHH